MQIFGGTRTGLRMFERTLSTSALGAHSKAASHEYKLSRQPSVDYYRFTTDVMRKNFDRTREFVNTPGEFAFGDVEVPTETQAALWQLNDPNIDAYTRDAILDMAAITIIHSDNATEKEKAFLTLLWLSQNEKVAVHIRGECADLVQQLNEDGHLFGMPRSELDKRYLDATGLRLDDENEGESAQTQLSPEMQLQLAKIVVLESVKVAEESVVVEAKKESPKEPHKTDAVMSKSARLSAELAEKCPWKYNITGIE